MNLSPTKGRSERGNILMITVWMMLIICGALFVYLQLSMNQTQVVARSQTWNGALPLVEAGLEDALNHCAWNFTNIISSGWSLSSSNTIYRTNSLADGWYKAIIATNSLVSNYITITTTGYNPMPGSSTYVPRTVRVLALRVPPYRFAVFGRSGVNFNGNGVRLDSYDSRSATKSTGGLYDLTKAGDQCNVGTYNGTPGAIYDVGNGNIWGHVYMGVGGKVTCGSNGKVGSTTWMQDSSIKTGVQAGWLRTDLNVSIPPVSVPFAAGSPPTSGTVGGVYYSAIFGDGVYETPTITGNALVTGTALIKVNGTVSCDLFRTKTNCAAILYCADSVSFKDTDNQTQRAANFQLMGLATCKSIDLDNEFMGAVYSPEASITLNGSKQIYGSIAADRITFKGGADLHFDEALKDPINASKPGFLITSWTEL